MNTRPVGPDSKHDLSGAIATLTAAKRQNAATSGPIVENTTAAPELRGTHSTGFDRAAQALLAAVATLTAWIKANTDDHSGQVIDYQADDANTPKAPFADAAWHKAKSSKAVAMVRSARKRSAAEPLENTTFVEYQGEGNLACWHTGDARNRRTSEVGTFVAMWVMDEDTPELRPDGRTVVMEDGSQLVMPRLSFFHFLNEDARMDDLEDLIADVRKAGASVKEHRRIQEENMFANPEESEDEF